MATILQSPLFVEFILPFLLIFAVVFAILQKSQILGENKKQVDAIVALVVGLIVISFAQATGLIINLTVFLGIALVITLVFLLLWGAWFHQNKFEIPKNVQLIAGGVALIAVTIAVLIFTGAWDYLKYEIFEGGSNNNLISNITFIVIILGAIGIIVIGGKGSSSSS
jgi:glycerol uptake facilitator-like aquaporin